MMRMKEDKHEEKEESATAKMAAEFGSKLNTLRSELKVPPI